MKSNYWICQTKYGIVIPWTPEEAEKLDTKNGNHLWRDTLPLEMGNTQVPFENIVVTLQILLKRSIRRHAVMLYMAWNSVKIWEERQDSLCGVILPRLHHHCCMLQLYQRKCTDSNPYCCTEWFEYLIVWYTEYLFNS